MSQAINELVRQLITFFKPADCDSMTSLIDSMPIITCAGKNKTGKVATEITTKGYCPTKNMYYFGLKLHTLAFRREGAIPFPEMIILSSAEENDLTVLKREAADNLENRYIFADKIYSDFSFWGEKQQEQGVKMLTPVKAIKGNVNPKYLYLWHPNNYLLTINWVILRKSYLENDSRIARI